jgi:hypothetical protein
MRNAVLAPAFVAICLFEPAFSLIDQGREGVRNEPGIEKSSLA